MMCLRESPGQDEVVSKAQTRVVEVAVGGRLNGQQQCHRAHSCHRIVRL